MPIPGLKTHAPTGAVPWPLVLLEGEEHAGKSWTLAEFSRSEKIGEMYWLPLGESGVADQYGRIPGARYEVVELVTGDYVEVMDVVTKISEYAQARKDAGDKPVVLAIDSISGVWQGLKDWTDQRARSSRRGREMLARDPHAEPPKPRNLWNDTNLRWSKLQRALKTFPGIVVVTARGRWVSKTGPDGQPVEGQKEWSVETNSQLTYATDVWVRMKRETGAEVVGVRSVEHGQRPGVERVPEPVTAPEAEGRLLEWLLFDVLGVDPSTAYVPEYREFGAGELTEEEKVRPEEPESDQGRAARQGRQGQQRRGRTKAQWVTAISECTDLDCTRALWMEAQRAGLLTADVDGVDLGDRIRARAEDIQAGRVKRGVAVTDAGRALVEEARRTGEVPADPEAAPAGGAQAGDQGAPDPSTTDEGPQAVSGEEAAEEPDSAEDQEPPPVDQVADPDVKDGKLRSATLAALAELYGSPDVLEAAVEQEYGKPLGMVGNRRLSDLLQKEQAGVSA
jgi:hypothetical protein